MKRFREAADALQQAQKEYDDARSIAFEELTKEAFEEWKTTHELTKVFSLENIGITYPNYQMSFKLDDGDGATVRESGNHFVIVIGDKTHLVDRYSFKRFKSKTKYDREAVNEILPQIREAFKHVHLLDLKRRKIQQDLCNKQ